MTRASLGAVLQAALDKGGVRLAHVDRHGTLHELDAEVAETVLAEVAEAVADAAVLDEPWDDETAEYPQHVLDGLTAICRGG